MELVAKKRILSDFGGVNAEIHYILIGGTRCTEIVSDKLERMVFPLSEVTEKGVLELFKFYRKYGHLK